MPRITHWSLGAVLLLGCGGAQSPESAIESGIVREERAAQREERAAAADEARYDPDARALLGASGPVALLVAAPEVYNPTDRYRERAQRHRQHANQHLERAAEYRTFEARECALVPSETRDACPLLVDVERVDDVDAGVRITFAAYSEMEPVVQELRCHIAFAAAEGREGMESCALYVPGAQVSVEGHAVLLTTNDRHYVGELRRRARQQAL